MNNYFLKVIKNFIILYLNLIVLRIFENKKIAVNIKTGVYNKILDDKIKINNSNMLNESLINIINNLIQKVLEENRKNRNEKTIKNNEIGEDKNIVSTSPNNNYYSNVHIKNITNIKGLTSNNISKNTGYNSNESENIDSQNKKIKGDGVINEKNKNELNVEKKINSHNINSSNKVYNNEIGFKKLGTKNIKRNNSRKSSQKKRKNLSLKNYIKNTKYLYEQDNKNRNNTTDINNMKNQNRENSKSTKEIISLNKNTKTFIANRNKNRSYTEKNLKDIKTFSTSYTKKTRNIIINKNNTFLNSNIKRKSFNKRKINSSKAKNKTAKNTINIKPNTENKSLENLSPKEKSYYILSTSPILRLNERILFGRSTKNLQKLQKISEILEKNKIYLKDKMKELNEKIEECDKKINVVFNASKTAEINFNFILSKDEDELKQFILLSQNEADKKEYYIYTKILYALFDENYENVQLNKLNDNLYVLLKKKGFLNIKDSLYYIFFKNKENINIIQKINNINKILEDTNYFYSNNFQIKFCRFALFTSFLIGEIINYGNNIKNIVDLKIKTKELIDVIQQKLDLYNNRIITKA